MQAHLLVEELVSAIAVRIGLHVAQVAHVANLVSRTRMRLFVRVEVRACSQAPIAQVAELVDMEAVFIAGSQTREGALNESASEGVLLLEEHDALAGLVGLRVEDADGATRL
mmetsp:Transcript_34592/g.45482  ORF Transcript_34592/g.45482 Transcript_34592/m.45482 type:complete len:112 (-) Transcript_34592:140-475(-)